MNGAPRMAPIPISSPASCPDTIATSGRRVSGSAVPIAARAGPTAPAARPKPYPPPPQPRAKGPADHAIAVLALIAVLPEYAVDFVFAWQGGASVQGFGPACPSTDPGAASPCSLALANMTGANRLLIGLGWTSVVFIAWYRTRRA